MKLQVVRLGFNAPAASDEGRELRAMPREQRLSLAIIGPFIPSPLLRYSQSLFCIINI